MMFGYATLALGWLWLLMISLAVCSYARIACIDYASGTLYTLPNDSELRDLAHVYIECKQHGV